MSKRKYLEDCADSRLRNRLRSIVATGLAILIAQLATSGQTQADEIHIRLDARHFVESCFSNLSAECDFPIFMSINRRVSLVCPSTLIPSDICATLPAQLTSQILSVLNGRFRKGCAETALWSEFRSARSSHLGQTDRIEIAELSSSSIRCMDIGDSQASHRRIFLLYGDGISPGFIDCDVSSSGNLFCNLYFSHASIQEPVVGLDSMVPSFVDSVEIFSFRPNQVYPFLLRLSSAIQRPTIVERRETSFVPNWFADLLNKKFNLGSIGEL